MIEGKNMEYPVKQNYDALNKTPSQLVEEQKAKCERLAKECGDAKTEQEFKQKDKEFQEAAQKLEEYKEMEKAEQEQKEADKEAIKNAASVSKSR